MLFNSFVFLEFFILVYTAYLLLSNHFRIQNILLLIASYVFYGYWNWRFLFLLGISTIIDFFLGKYLEQAEDPIGRKILLTLSIVFNISILGFFKYFNFFADSLIRLLHLIGFPANEVSLNIILPIGISFYTFQKLTYTIDIYREKLKPTDRFIDFALFVAFFPQLLAGPIERATNIIPQISSHRKIKLEQLNAGIFLIIWGFFKKVVIADNIGTISDQVFDNYVRYHGFDIFIAILALTVQIYCDFSGYSDIARGLCKLMGFELMVNFKLPYFAINPSDFWARWHISLSTWLRDYLYIPLGGNRKGKFKTYRNLSLTMLLCGLWHGAAWNFVIWGAFHGSILILYRIFDKNPEHLDPWGGQYPYPRVLIKMLFMFILTNIGWVIFRSTSIDQIVYILTNVGLSRSGNTLTFLNDLVFFSLPLIVVQLYQYLTCDLLILSKLTPWLRVPAYSFFIIWTSIFGFRKSVEFIYFQF